MPQHIEVPGMGLVDFPDWMNDKDIASAIDNQLKSSPATKSEVTAPAPIKPATPTTQQSSEGQPPRATSAGATPKQQTPWEAIQHVARDPVGYLKHVASGIAEQVKAPRQAFEAGRAGTPPTTEEMIAPAMNMAMLGGLKLGKGMGAPAGEPVGKLPPAVEKIANAAEPKPVEVEVEPAPAQQPLTGVPPAVERVTEAAKPSEADHATGPEKLGDDLYRLQQSFKADLAEVAGKLKKVPEQFRDPEVGERLYHAGESTKEMAKLAPEEQQAFQQHVEPMRQELFQRWNNVKSLIGEEAAREFDPQYMHRIVKGKAPQYESHDPVTGGRSITRSTSAMQERRVFALRDEQGSLKKIVPASDYELGQTVGKDKVTQATTKEIEANTNLKYHKNAFVNTADALVRMRQVERNIIELERMKGDLMSSGNARTVRGNQPVPKGWRETQLSAMRGWAFPEKYARQLDDFHHAGFEGMEGLRKINRWMTSAIFTLPFGHIENVAGHWFVGRGWDWVRPGVMKGFTNDMRTALHEVLTQGPKMQEMMREGSAMISPGVENADFYRQMGKRFGMDIERHWGEFKPYFDKIGLRTPYEAIAWWYEKQRNILWKANDVFMMHRVLELQRTRGVGMRAAIKEAEKDIPNYRLPTQVLGSRTLQKALADPAVTIFSRYHYGVFKAYLNTVSDMLKGIKDPAERKAAFEASGKVMAMVVLAAGVYPLLDYAKRMLTGKKEQKLRRGPLGIPEVIKDIYEGDTTGADAISRSFTLAPFTRELLQQGTQRDFFTGKTIQPWEAPGHALGGFGPYQQGKQLLGGKEGGRSVTESGLDLIFGYKDMSDPALKQRKISKAFRQKDAIKSLAKLKKFLGGLGVE